MSEVLLVSNKASGSSDEATHSRVADSLSGLGEVRHLQPSSLESFDQEVSDAAGRAAIVVVAGGDGTFNRTRNALGGMLSEIRMGLVPMGTGNDLARTLGLPQNPVDAAAAIARGPLSTLDVCRARRGDGRVDRLFANACMGGFPVQVNREMDEDLKRKFGPVAFWVGGLKAASRLAHYEVTVDGAHLQNVIAVGVGNGKTCGGGIRVWPHAEPDDGLLDVCALAAADLPRALRLAGAVKNGSHVELDGVHTSRGRSVSITSSPSVEFNTDGELDGLETPATFEVATSLTVLTPA
jgi:diacylglycerol kinase (ATP)